MTQILEEKKQKLKEKKKKIELAEKGIVQKERKLKVNQRIFLGSLVEKSGLEFIDPDALLGALLEISEQAKEETNIQKWIQFSQEFQKKNIEHPLIVSFEQEAEPEARKLLKNYGFKWNRFRKEWYGYSNIEKIKSELSTWSPKIEKVQD